MFRIKGSTSEELKAKLPHLTIDDLNEIRSKWCGMDPDWNENIIRAKFEGCPNSFTAMYRCVAGYGSTWWIVSVRVQVVNGHQGYEFYSPDKYPKGHECETKEDAIMEFVTHGLDDLEDSKHAAFEPFPNPKNLEHLTEKEFDHLFRQKVQHSYSRVWNTKVLDYKLLSSNENRALYLCLFSMDYDSTLDENGDPKEEVDEEDEKYSCWALDTLGVKRYDHYGVQKVDVNWNEHSYRREFHSEQEARAWFASEYLERREFRFESKLFKPS